MASQFAWSQSKIKVSSRDPQLGVLIMGIKLGVQWTPKLPFNESVALEKHLGAAQLAALSWRAVQGQGVRESGSQGI